MEQDWPEHCSYKLVLDAMAALPSVKNNHLNGHNLVWHNPGCSLHVQKKNNESFGL